MSPWLSDLFLRSQSDQRLVSLAGAGHDRAFAAIVERYRPELQAHARRLSADGRAEDIVQQAFLSAFAALRSGTEVGHLRGWLHQIVRNAAIRLPAPRELPIDEVTLAGAALEDDVDARALALSALSEVGRLPARQREALVGTVQGRRRAEIAMSMGLSEGAVRQLVHRARMSIRATITAISPYPLARWLAAARPGAGEASEIAMTLGAASAGGAAMKFGALIASGVVAGGIVIEIEPRPHPQRPAQHASPRAHGARGASRRGGGPGPAVAGGGGPSARAVVAAELIGSGGRGRSGRGERGRGGPGSVRGSDDRLPGSEGASGRGDPGASEEHGDGGGSGPGGAESSSGSGATSGPGPGATSGSGSSATSGSGSGSSPGGPGPSTGGSLSSSTGGGAGPSTGGGPGPSTGGALSSSTGGGLSPSTGGGPGASTVGSSSGSSGSRGGGSSVGGLGSRHGP